MSQNHRLSARLAAFGGALMLLTGCSTTSAPSETSTPSQSASTSRPSATSTPSGSAGSSSPSATTAPSPSSTATAAACTAADAFGDALTSFKDSLEAGAAVEDVRGARDQVVNSFNNLNAALGNVTVARLDALRSAEARLDAAVKAIPDDATLAQALDSLKQEANNVQAALSDFLTVINC